MEAAVIPIAPAIQLQGVLYATDFSDSSRAALSIAAAIARHYGSRLYIAHVWPMPLVEAMQPTTPSPVQLAEEWAKTQMAKLVRVPELETIDTVALLRSGDANEELMHIVAEEKIDLLVTATHARTGASHSLLGSVAEALFRHSVCPVLTVGPKAAKRSSDLKAIKTIVVPLDMSPESKSVLPIVTALAAEFAARVCFVHVLPEELADNPEAGKLTEPLRAQLLRELDGRLSPRCAAEIIFECGKEGETIARIARVRNAELIVMAVRRGFGADRALGGTTAYKIVTLAECPVLTCKASL